MIKQIQSSVGFFLILLGSQWIHLGLVQAQPTVERRVLRQELARAQQYLLHNLLYPGISEGIVIASPSRQNPDYFYHWVRDAGLAMAVVAEWHDHFVYPAKIQQQVKWDLTVGQSQLENLLWGFARQSRHHQLSPAIGGMGEPKFYVDGRPYQGPWGRPQNDGPALRAIALMRFARTLLREQRRSEVLRELYHPALPAQTVIKADLEFVSHHWQDLSFDYWEEVEGQHFSTLMVQRRALHEGAELARELGDAAAADWYQLQAQLISQSLEAHWNAKSGRIMPTLRRRGGLDYKHSDLDMSVILAVLHGEIQGQSFSVQDPRVFQNLEQIAQAFRQHYPLNASTSQDLAPALGRYPEDRYNGWSTNGQGNPWFLTTLAAAEFHYRRAAQLGARSPAGLAALAAGDAYWRRARQHAGAQGEMAEQFHAQNGYMQGAEHLTWSYASLVTALWHRMGLVTLFP